MIYFGPNPYQGDGFYFGDPFDLLGITVTDDALIATIYLMLGLTDSDIPEAVIQIFIDDYQLLYPDNECKVLYNTTISVYEWLIRRANVLAVEGKRREKKGQREIEIEDSNKTSSWKKALDSFLKSPWEVYPQCRTDFTSSALSRIIVGGVSSTEVSRVQDRSDSYSAYSEKSPFSPSTPEETKLL
jgi:hypothetical protein